MSHFYGTVQGSRGAASRTGGSGSGITTHAASWQGCVRTTLYVDQTTGRDFAVVELTSWRGRGTEQVLYRGPVGEYAPAVPASQGRVG